MEVSGGGGGGAGTVVDPIALLPIDITYSKLAGVCCKQQYHSRKSQSLNFLFSKDKYG